MSRSVLAAALAVLLPLSALAQVVRVTKTDGKVIQGELLGYEAGRYHVRVAGGTVEDIEEARIKDIALISPTGQGPATGRNEGVLEAARAAFERNDVDLAFQKIAEATRSLDDDGLRRRS